MAMHRLGTSLRSSPAAPESRWPTPPEPRLRHPAADPVRIIERACAGLQDQRPRTIAAYRVNQSSQALMAAGLRLTAATSLPLPPQGRIQELALEALAERLALLAELGVASPGATPGAAPGALAADIMRLTPRLERLATPYPLGAAHILIQIRSDALYLARAAGDAEPGLHVEAADRPPPPNRLAAHALSLARLANDGGRRLGPNAAVAVALRLVGADLLSIVVNAGGADMPGAVQARAGELTGTYDAVLRGQETLVRAGAALIHRLRAFVAALLHATGSAWGTQHALAALMSDVRALDVAVQPRLGRQ